MSFLSGMLGIIVGFLVVAVIICIVIFIIYKKLTSTITETIGIENLNEIKNAAKNVKNLKDEEYTREKNVSGNKQCKEKLRLFTVQMYKPRQLQYDRVSPLQRHT